MSPFEDVKKSQTADQLTDDQSDSDRVFDEFCADRETIAGLEVTAEELRELSRASLLGTLTSKDDLLFMLRQIRAAMNPATPPSNAPALNHLAETMRLKALAKLDELDLMAERRRRSAVGRLEAAMERVSIKLSLARILIVQISQKRARRSVTSRPV